MPLPPAQKALLMSYKLGAMDYIVAGRDDSAMFARARRLNLAGVEVNLKRTELRDSSAARLASLKAAKASSGLAITALVMGEHNYGGLGSSNESTQQAARSDLEQAIVWAAELDVQNILVPFFGDGELISDADLERATAGFKALAPIAAARGVTLCFEGTIAAGQVIAMAEQVASPAFGCYFDVANPVSRGQDPATELRRLGALVRQVHIKEHSPTQHNAPLGHGFVDHAACAAALREIGYSGWLVLETGGGLDALTARDISYTRRFYPGIEWQQAWPRYGNFSYDFKSGEIGKMAEAFNKAGLSTVQIGLGLLDDALENPDKIKSELDAAGIEVVAVAGYRNLVTPDVDKRRANIEFLQRCLEVAPLLGCEVVATETGTLNPQSDWVASPFNWSRQAWQSFQDAMGQLLPVAEQHGSILALEGYVNNVLITHPHLEAIFHEFPTRHLQAVLDPYNYISAHLVPTINTTVDNFFKRFEHRFVLAHLKDVDAAGAEVNTPEFGLGVFPQDRYIRFLRDERPDLALVMEHLPFAHVADVKQRVEAIIQNLD
jgi:sugar phosphate isomerase/epimerase